MRTGLAALGLPVLSGCSAVGAFNVLAGSPPGVTRAATSLAFGEGPRHTLDIYRPAAGKGPWPVVVFLYGGSWNSGDKGDYAFAGEALAAMGFVAVVSDTRLVPEVLFPGFIEDAAQAVAFTAREIGRYGGNPRRIALMGHSAGAYNAAMLALDPRYLARAGVSRSAIRAFAGLSGPYDFLPFEGRITRTTFGSWPRPEDTQPMTFAGRGAPPAFLATGADDNTVHPRNTQALARRLRGIGAPVTEKIYPGLGHAGTVTALSENFPGHSNLRDDLKTFLKSRL